MRCALSITEFEVAWRLVQPGELPLIFRGGMDQPGLLDDERTRITADVLTSLRAKGLADDRGVSGDLVDALTLLAMPSWVVDVRIDRPGGGRADRVRGYGACVGDSALIAVLDHERLTIAETTRYRLPADMVRLAGELPPGDGRSINLTADVLLAAAQDSGGDTYEFIDELTARGVPRVAARTLATINETVVRTGQFGVTYTSGATLHRAPKVIGYFDTPTGRWAQRRQPASDGREWITTTPASTDQLTTMVKELLAEVGAEPVRA